MKPPCTICGCHVATEADWRDIPEGEGEHLCWGGPQCVDTRDERIVELTARADAAERELSLWREYGLRAWSHLLEAGDREACTPQTLYAAIEQECDDAADLEARAVKAEREVGGVVIEREECRGPRAGPRGGASAVGVVRRRQRGLLG